MADLANQTDATSYGYGTIASGMFKRASARVRLYAKSRGYSVDPATYTTTVRGSIARLPNRPVRSITSVTDVEDSSDTYVLESDEWVLRNGGILETPGFGGNLSVVYLGGYATLPDEVVELVCAVASRMANTAAGAASGVQQETGGSESVTYGFDSFTGISDLTKGELASLGRMFPTLPGVVVLRP
jgi:hypothetical protein